MPAKGPAFPLSNIEYCHGLTHEEPLILEEVIKSCFSNPNRKQFPNFLYDLTYSEFRRFNAKFKDAASMIGSIRAEAIESFNQAKIKLHDIDLLNDYISRYEEEKTDRQLYLSNIMRSKWYGPYTKFIEVEKPKKKRKDPPTEIEPLDYCLVSIIKSGTNRYYCKIEINTQFHRIRCGMFYKGKELMSGLQFGFYNF